MNNSTEKEKDMLPVKQSDIEDGFHQLGLSNGDVVEVHSSLSSFGKVEGGALTVINALIQTIGEQGTIVMSAYPISPAVKLSEEEKIRGISWKTKVLPEDSPEKTGMGIIVDTFKTRSDVVCGHGIHRVCVWGNNKKQFVTGYESLLKKDGLVLLIGVGIDRCSSMHLAEEVSVPEAINDYDKVPDEIKKDYPPNQWQIGVGNGTPEDGWKKVFQKADLEGLIKHIRIGNAECHLFKSIDLVGMLREWRISDPNGLYGVPKDSSKE